MSFARDALGTGHRPMYSPREGPADVLPRRRLPTDQATIAHLERQRRFGATPELLTALRRHWSAMETR
jgi:hypothetical protein